MMIGVHYRYVRFASEVLNHPIQAVTRMQACYLQLQVNSAPEIQHSTHGSVKCVQTAPAVAMTCASHRTYQHA